MISEHVQPIQEFDFLIDDHQELEQLKRDIENMGDMEIHKKEYALRRMSKFANNSPDGKQLGESAMRDMESNKGS